MEREACVCDHGFERSDLRCCCCFSHSAHWLPTRKKLLLLYTVANPARGLLNREKKKKKKSGSAPPSPPPRAARSEKKKKSRGASTCICLGATQVGVMCGNNNNNNNIGELRNGRKFKCRLERLVQKYCIADDDPLVISLFPVKQTTYRTLGCLY